MVEIQQKSCQYYISMPDTNKDLGNTKDAVYGGTKAHPLASIWEKAFYSTIPEKAAGC